MCKRVSIICILMLIAVHTTVMRILTCWQMRPNWNVALITLIIIVITMLGISIANFEILINAVPIIPHFIPPFPFLPVRRP